MRGSVLFCLGGTLIISGCAHSSQDISASYVSPLLYQNYNCAQLQEEATRVSARAAQASGVQDQKATSDAVATTVGAVVFWPALFFIKGDSTTGADVARLKGEMDAIEQANIQKQCGIQFSTKQEPKKP